MKKLGMLNEIFEPPVFKEDVFCMHAKGKLLIFPSSASYDFV